MSALIFDIETVGEDYEALDETTKESLTRWIKKESSSEEEYKILLQDLKDGLGFSSLTGEIVAIGVLDSEKEQGAVYYQAPGEEDKEFEEDGMKFRSMSEKGILEYFWKVAQKYQDFVSFNGRGFDAPFMMVRSAIHKIRPTKNLMPNRYLGSASSAYDAVRHIDLQDQLTFYGAVRKKGSLHLWARAFGIESPKADGVSGDDVGRLFKEGKHLEVAKYNVRDLKATRALHDYWKKYLFF